MDDWLKVYGKDVYKEVLQDAKESEAMQTFLNVFTLDMIVYTLSSMAHSFFLVGAGFVGAYLVFDQTQKWDTA